MVIAFSIILLSTSLDVRAEALGTVKVGTARQGSGWVYGAPYEFEIEPLKPPNYDDYYYAGEPQTYIYESTFNIPLDFSGLPYQFGSNVSSVIMSLTSDIQYGATLDWSVPSEDGFNYQFTMTPKDIVLLLNGEEYRIPFKNSYVLEGGYVFDADDDMPTYKDTDTETLNLGSYIPFDLGDFKSLSKWNCALRVTYDMFFSFSHEGFDTSYFEVRPWMQWYVGTSGSTFEFYTYSSNDAKMQSDLIRLQQDSNKIAQNQLTEQKEQTEEMKEQTETQKGMLSKMSEFFGGFFDNLKNAVIGLFVPSKEEMGSLFDRLMEFFNDTFGFLFYPFDFIVRLVELFLTSTNDNTSIVFPGFSIMGVQVWETMEIDLAQYEVTRELFGYVRMVTGAIISFGFIEYLRKYFDKRFGGGGN